MRRELSWGMWMTRIDGSCDKAKESALRICLKRLFVTGQNSLHHLIHGRSASAVIMTTLTSQETRGEGSMQSGGGR